MAPCDDKRVLGSTPDGFECPICNNGTVEHVEDEVRCCGQCGSVAKNRDFRLDPKYPFRASIHLDERHELVVNRTDGGIVLEVWKAGEDQSDPVWSTGHFDCELMLDEE